MTNKITIDYMDKIEALANAATAEVLGKPMYRKDDLIFMGAAREAVPKLIAEVRRLKTELAQARAATVQWVTYDGTPETLPEISLGAVIINVRRKYTGYIPLFVYRVAICVNNNWDSAHALPLPAEIGDRWAYLPEPPEVME